MPRRALFLAAAAALATPALAAGPLQVTSQVLAEQRIAAPDGTTRVQLVKPRRAGPGDRVVILLAYRNTGPVPIADLVLANPVPAGLAYRGPHAGSPAPEVSADGRTFAPLRAGMPAADVTAVRWRLPRALPAGGAGQFAFDATVR